MQTLHYKKIAAALIALALIGGFSGHVKTARAQTNAINTEYTLLTPLPTVGACPTGSTCSNGQITTINLSQAISYGYKFMLALAVVLAVFMITVGGFEYMLSGAADTKSDAVKRMTNAAAGLILALIAYLLLYTIDPNLVNPNELNAITPITYGNLTQTNGSVATLNNQLQQDALNQNVRENVATLDSTAATEAQQATDAYTANNCATYDQSPKSYQFPSNAPQPCLDAAQAYNQSNNTKTQAILAQQLGSDAQTLTSVDSAISDYPGLVRCTTGTPGTSSGTGVNECYNGYQLNPAAVGQINQQITNLTAARNSATQQMSAVSNGSQYEALTEAQYTNSAINQKIHNALVSGTQASQGVQQAQQSMIPAKN